MNELKVDLSDIAGTPGARGRYSVLEHLAPTEDFSCISPVRGEITVENVGSLLITRGRMEVSVRLSCVRCLREFERAVTVEFEEEYATDYTAPDVSTIDREEPDTAAISGFTLDLTELARQQVTVNVPMASVCRPKCRGICPRCGQNLNDGPCECAVEPADGRWAKLQDLLDNRADEGEE